MKKKQINLFRLIFFISDTLLVNFCLGVCFLISGKYHNPADISTFLELVLGNSTIWIFCAGFFRLYGTYTIYKLKDISRATWRSVAFHAIVFQIYVYLIPAYRVSAFFLFFYYAVLTSAFFIGRFCLKRLKDIVTFDFPNRRAHILAIASMGGHWVELLRFMPVFNDNRVIFVSNTPDLKHTVEGHTFYAVPDANRKNGIELTKCILSVFGRILLLRPQIIVTTGAAPGLVAVVIGKIFGAKTIWIDSIANVDNLSLSGRIAIKIASRVYTQWEHLAGRKVIFSGNVF